MSRDAATFFALPPERQAEALADVARVALAQWNVPDAAPTLLKHRENAVFKVTAPDGRPAALRVHRQGYHSDASLRSELAWMQVLRDGGVVAPAPIPAASGDLVVKAEADAAPGVWQVDMLGWLGGRQLGDIGEPLDMPAERRTPTFAALGDCAAHVHEISTAWRRPVGFERHAWDLDGLLGEQPLWGRFWDLAALSPAQVALMQRARERTRVDLAAHGCDDTNFGLIHADMLPENVLIEGDELQLIDFDDAGFGWHMFELATALFWFQDEPDFDDLAAATLKGYRARRDLPDREWDALPLFTLLRGFTYLGWVHTRHGTETARELTPMMVEIVCGLADGYLAAR